MPRIFPGLLLLFAASRPALAAPDPATGEALFRSRACAVCHSLSPGRSMNGPSLAGVFGRPVGKAPGYRYSADFQKAKGSWDAGRLDAYLADPRALFPSSRMAISVPSPADRAALIAYLRTNPVK